MESAKGSGVGTESMPSGSTSKREAVVSSFLSQPVIRAMDINMQMNVSKVFLIPGLYHTLRRVDTKKRTERETFRFFLQNGRQNPSVSYGKGASYSNKRYKSDMHMDKSVIK